MHEWGFLLFDRWCQQARILDIQFVDETLVSAEEIFDLPVLGVWGCIICTRVSIGACHCEQCKTVERESKERKKAAHLKRVLVSRGNTFRKGGTRAPYNPQRELGTDSKRRAQLRRRTVSDPT